MDCDADRSDKSFAHSIEFTAEISEPLWTQREYLLQLFLGEMYAVRCVARRSRRAGLRSKSLRIRPLLGQSLVFIGTLVGAGAALRSKLRCELVVCVLMVDSLF